MRDGRVGVRKLTANLRYKVGLGVSHSEHRNPTIVARYLENKPAHPQLLVICG